MERFNMNSMHKSARCAALLGAALAFGAVAPAWAITVTVSGLACNAAADPGFEPALDAALADPTVDLINFNCAMAAQNITTPKLIDRTLTIDGDNPAGPADMVLSQTGTTPAADRHFTVDVSGDLSLRDITLLSGFADGAAVPENQGGTIFNAGTASLTRVTIDDSAAFFGAIFNAGTLSVTGSNIGLTGGMGTIAGSGAGIFNLGPGTATISGSRFHINIVADPGAGAAIHNAGGAVTLTKSTIHQAGASASGAALVNATDGLGAGGTMSVINTTINDLGAAPDAPGVLSTGLGSVLTLINSTVAPDIGSSAVTDSEGQIVLSNTAMNNVAAVPECVSISGGTFTAAGVNVVADTSCATLVGSSANFFGVGGSADPLLGAAAGTAIVNTDGVTQTVRPLMAGSPAIDKGDSVVCAGAEVGNVDQLARTRLQDGDGNGTVLCDVGAFEVPGADTDADGVANSIEAQVPTRDASGNIIPGLFGDGNGDGVADSGQMTVASLLASNNASYITVQAVTGGALTLVSLSGDFPAPTPVGFTFPFGLLRFTTAMSPANVVITYPAAVGAYFKFNNDAATAAQTPLGYTRADQGLVVIAGITGNKVTLNLTNAMFGDVDGGATITDPGAAAAGGGGGGGGPCCLPGGGSTGGVVIEDDDDDSGCTIGRGNAYELLILALFAAFGIWRTRRRSAF
ncbi:MAG: choice-of-anchor Q domain-containing protein [Nevskiales bacterium]